MPETWLAIFVGGASSRMGGKPKGLLVADDARTPRESIVARLIRLAAELNLTPVFVGTAEPYALHWPQVRVIGDEPTGIGPLGGLSGVLAAAGQARVLAVACDMPQVTSALLQRLLNTAPAAPVLASKNQDGRWDPLCARYDPHTVRPRLQMALAQGVRSFQRLFESLPVTELELDAQERVQLVDWDTPEDIPR
jgi:molybdenum cofactor guanylyltransferase